MDSARVRIRLDWQAGVHQIGRSLKDNGGEGELYGKR
jgi:hypothetical protein